MKLFINYLTSLTPIAIIVVSLLAVVQPVTASNVSYIQDARYITNRGYVDELNGDYTIWSETYFPDTPFSDWSFDNRNFSNQGSSQTSALGVHTISATGSASVDYLGEGGPFFAVSFFDISFSLSNATQIDLTGLVSAANGEGFGGSYDTSVFLYQGTELNPGNIIYSPATIIVPNGFINGSLDILFSNTLAAGDYRLIAAAVPAGNFDAVSFSLGADFAPVPLPAAAPLLLFSLSGLMFFLRKVKKPISLNIKGDGGI